VKPLAEWFRQRPNVLTDRTDRLVEGGVLFDRAVDVDVQD
jgi:hypothetical protein